VQTRSLNAKRAQGVIIQYRKIILYSFLAGLALLQFFPLVWIIYYSLQKSGDLFGSELFKTGATLQWRNYVKAFVDGRILAYSLNSLVIVSASMVLTGFLSFCVGYACSRMRWKFSKLFQLFLSLGMVLPIHVTLLPNFIWFNYFGLIDTAAGVIILYSAFQLTWSSLVVSAYLSGIPREMEESAFMDGATYPVILFKIIAPLAVPGIVTVSIAGFLAFWNEYIVATTYLSSDAKRTLPFSIVRFQGQYASDYAVQFACMVLVALPSILVYVLLSKRIMAGAMAGAVKG
jgi:raffinose/stachyose/melibiose transport system permease protein